MMDPRLLYTVHEDVLAGLAGHRPVLLHQLDGFIDAGHAGRIPTANLIEPNPYYDDEKSPFRFLDRARPWTGDVRRAGVSAFGFGGTNFHAIVSRHDGDDAPAFGVDEWPAELFVLRADGISAVALAEGAPRSLF